MPIIHTDRIKERRKLFVEDFRRICIENDWCTHCTNTQWALFADFLQEDMDKTKIHKLAEGVIAHSDEPEADETEWLLHVMYVLAQATKTWYEYQ